MWAKAYRNFPHSNQDTNNAIESYHRYIKERYLCEKNNACHRRVDWLIYVLLTKVVLFYNHMHRLKEAGFVRPRKIQEQLNSSKCRAKKIPNEDCVPDEKSNDYWVRSQNKDTRDIWYNVIYKGSNLHFCNCNWALNGNICKHVLKVEMLVSNTILGENVAPGVTDPTTERPRILFDLNETPILVPEIQTELFPCFDSPPNLNYHNETSIDNLENFSYNVESTNVRQDSAFSEHDEMKRVNSSTLEKLRSIIPTNLEQAYALNNLVDKACQEYNKMFFNTITPSKITTKRKHSFLSPVNKKRRCGRKSKSGTDILQFERVGRVHARKKRMDEKLESSSHKQGNMDHAPEIIQDSIIPNIGMEMSCYALFYVNCDILSCSTHLHDYTNYFYCYS